MSSPVVREQAVLARLAARLAKAPKGQLWVGDDAALLAPLAHPLFASDLIVEGVHVDRRWCTLADVGFKAIAVNVSDIAAMGGTPRAVVVSIVGATAKEIDQLMEGAASAAQRFGCPIVGGDISDGATMCVAVAIIGEASTSVVTRAGARPGDLLYVTGPLGAAAAGLRQLRADHAAHGVLQDAHRRPIARVAEGRLLAELGAHAMLDCSDGLSIDVDRLAIASGVGVVLSEAPVAPGATPDEALDGGEDYELIVGIAPEVDVLGAFQRAGLRQPLSIGYLSDDVNERICAGQPFTPRGYEHQLGIDS